MNLQMHFKLVPYFVCVIDTVCFVTNFKMSSKPIIIVGIRFYRCEKYIYRSGSRVLVTDDSMHTHGSVTMIPFSNR